MRSNLGKPGKVMPHQVKEQRVAPQGATSSPTLLPSAGKMGRPWNLSWGRERRRDGMDLQGSLALPGDLLPSPLGSGGSIRGWQGTSRIRAGERGGGGQDFPLKPSAPPKCITQTSSIAINCLQSTRQQHHLTAAHNIALRKQ